MNICMTISMSFSMILSMGSVGVGQLIATKMILNSEEQCMLLIMMTSDDRDDDGSGGGDGNCDRIFLSNGCFQRQRC